MKRTIRIGVAILLVLTMVLPVFSAGKAESGKTTIRYANFSAGESNAETLRKMVDLFEAKNPTIKVELESMGYGDNYWTSLITRIAGGDPPDAFELNMEQFLAFTLRKSNRALDDLFTKTGTDVNLFGEGLLDAVSFDGKIMAIPQSFSTVVLVYNKELFDRANTPYPRADWTWDDALQAALKISALGKDIWGTFNPIQFWEFYKVVQQNGGGLMTPDGKELTINTPQNVASLEYMLDRMWKYHVMPTVEEQAGRPEADMFVDGKLGMWLNGVWAFTDLKDRVKFPWGIEMEPGNLTKATHFFGNVGCISTTTKYPEETFKFLTFMATDPDVVQLRLDAQWELPTVGDPTVMQRYLADTPPDNKEAVLNSLQYAVKPPALLQFSELTNIVNTKIEQARDGQLTAKQALDQAQAEAREKIRL
ncbi:MAG: sugar ABC transporter substrate-binding protein [Sphaerochaeta sp.]|nr:sugar ABC transporter substrate-binding protein [Sphaerochaeta sp.]